MAYSIVTGGSIVETPRKKLSFDRGVGSKVETETQCCGVLDRGALLQWQHPEWVLVDLFSTLKWLDP